MKNNHDVIDKVHYNYCYYFTFGEDVIKVPLFLCSRFFNILILEQGKLL